jgi:aryl-alcohol dehydrogenase-like predicted oxidoreductase
MKYRHMGTHGPKVSAIGLGCMVMPGFYNPGDEAESIKTLQRAPAIGVTFLDTSDAYGFGKNEELVGKAIKGRRDDYVIASKFGNIRDADGKPAVDGRPAYVAKACEASLKRLGIDVIDIYYQHRIDPKVPIEDTVGAMAKLVAEGKVRHLGLSEAAPETLQRAHATHPICSLQTEYSLWTRHAEDELLPLCRRLGIGFAAYSPLGRGMFSGAITAPESLTDKDRRKEHPRFQGDNLAANLKLVEPVRAFAKEKGCSTAEIALAWLLHKGDLIVPIPGTRKAAHLEANARAPEIKLTGAEIARLDKAVPAAAVKGERYPPGALKHVHK